MEIPSLSYVRINKWRARKNAVTCVISGQSTVIMTGYMLILTRYFKKSSVRCPLFFVQDNSFCWNYSANTFHCKINYYFHRQLTKCIWKICDALNITRCTNTFFIPDVYLLKGLRFKNYNICKVNIVSSVLVMANILTIAATSLSSFVWKLFISLESTWLSGAFQIILVKILMMSWLILLVKSVQKPVKLNASS